MGLVDHESSKWEKIDGNSDRLKVPGGWIVRSWSSVLYGVSIHQIFVADHQHKWTIDDIKK